MENLEHMPKERKICRTSLVDLTIIVKISRNYHFPLYFLYKKCPERMGSKADEEPPFFISYQDTASYYFFRLLNVISRRSMKNICTTGN